MARAPLSLLSSLPYVAAPALLFIDAGGRKKEGGTTPCADFDPSRRERVGFSDRRNSSRVIARGCVPVKLLSDGISRPNVVREFTGDNYFLQRFSSISSARWIVDEMNNDNKLKRNPR